MTRKQDVSSDLMVLVQDRSEVTACLYVRATAIMAIYVCIRVWAIPHGDVCGTSETRKGVRDGWMEVT